MHVKKIGPVGGGAHIPDTPLDLPMQTRKGQ